MAQQHQPQYEFRYQRVELVKTESLGNGSYGAVYKAMYDDLPCAAKILHPALFQFTAPEDTSVKQKFEQECRLLRAINHPHIVQYLGTYQDPESRLPVLLMELMDESLTQFLKRSHKPLPYHTEVNFCHDIALALSYLHSNGIVHRDLSSNNVLLIAGSRAKVTDFGMVKLYNVSHSKAHLTTLTQCPGTTVYMSPEALWEHPIYTDKLDSFSLGVLCVQITTRQFPDPGDRFQAMETNDPRAPSGRVQVEIPEIKRRRSHIDLIDPAHPLLPVALDCLKDRDTERPSCHELCGRMLTLKASPKYTESVQQSQVNTKPTQSTNRESREREIQQSQQIQHLQQQLGGLQRQLAGKDHQLRQKEAAIVAGQQEIQQLRQQLQTSEQVTAKFQQNLLESSREEWIQRQQLRERGGQRREEVEASGAAASGGSIKLRWRDGGRAPCQMGGGVVAVDGSVAYIRRGDMLILSTEENSVYAYNSEINKWSELPECPYYDFSLAMVNGLLTAIGGKKKMKDSMSYEVTNSLLSYTGKKWTKKFPPMPTKRCWTAVVCSGKSLVVAGGSTRPLSVFEKISTVEVMDTKTLQWSTATSLPFKLSHASATLCGDQVYMLGGLNRDSFQSQFVFSCSLAALLQSCQPQGGRLKSLASRSKDLSKSEVWHQLADTPCTFSTYASAHGRLLAVGGVDSDGNKTAAIHMYNTTTNSWEVISHMATPRNECLVAVLPHNELMVVGGSITGGDVAEIDSVEIATIV